MTIRFDSRFFGPTFRFPFDLNCSRLPLKGVFKALNTIKKTLGVQICSGRYSNEFLFYDIRTQKPLKSVFLIKELTSLYTVVS